MGSHRAKFILGIAGASAFFAISITLFIFYVIYNKEASLSLIATELAQADSEGSANSAMKHLLVDTISERSELNNYFVGNDNAASFSFIDSLENLSRIAKVDMSVNTVNLEPADLGDMFEYVSVNATAEGSYANVYWFLRLIEEMPLKHEVRSISFDKFLLDKGENKKVSVWRLTFVIRALKLK